MVPSPAMRVPSHCYEMAFEKAGCCCEVDIQSLLKEMATKTLLNKN